MPDPARLRKWLLLCGALALAGTAMAAPAAAPASPWADELGKARDALGRGDGIEAEVEIRKAMEEGAARPDVAAYMGEALLVQGDLRKAREWLGAGEFSPATAALGFRNLGRLERAANHLPESGAAYDKALKLTPKDAMLWIDIARLRYSGGEHVLAVQAVDHALALDPRNPRAIEFKGQIERDREGNAAALPWFERGLALAPRDMSLLAEYAGTLGEMGRAREMLAIARRMVEIDPRDPRPYFLQAVLAARADRIDVGRALMNRTEGKLDAIPAAMLLQGALELRAGNPDVAVKWLERLLLRQPGNARARMLLARSLAASGEDLYLVRRFAEETAQPDSPPYLQTLVARAYENLGQRDKAGPLLDRAVRSTQRFVSPAWKGSLIAQLLGAGRLAEANAVAGRALAANPGSADLMGQAGDVELAAGRGDAAYALYARSSTVRLSESLTVDDRA